MDHRQAGTPQGAEQPGAASAAPAQMEGSQPRGAKSPGQSAFGSGGGAALVFRDYASI